MNLFFANIGSRDILLNGNKIIPSRTEGENIYNSLQEYKSEIQFPILNPALNYIFDQDVDNIDQMVIFVTDQSDKQFKSGDTIYFGKIIKQILPKIFKSKIKKISLQVLQDEVNYYDSMFSYYRNYFNEIQYADVDKVFVLATGGIPACNMGLIFHSIDYYQDKVISLYVSEKTRKIIKINMGKQLFDHFYKKAMQNYLASYDYPAITTFKQSDKNIAFLAQAAQHRLNFNFDTALQCLHNYRSLSGNAGFTTLKLHLENLLNGDRSSLIIELLNNIRVKINRKEYVDVVGRLFRLEEAVLGHFVEQDLKISVNRDKKEGFKKFEQGVKKYPALENSLKKIRISGEPLDYKTPNRETLRAILQFLHKENPCNDKYRQIADLCNRLKPFSELRNNSILAHGFKGVSSKDFENLNPSQLLSGMEFLFEFDIKTLGFEKINIRIKEILLT